MQETVPGKSASHPLENVVVKEMNQFPELVSSVKVFFVNLARRIEI
jgi:hypothetical protein